MPRVRHAPKRARHAFPYKATTYAIDCDETVRPNVGRAVHHQGLRITYGARGASRSNCLTRSGWRFHLARNRARCEELPWARAKHSYPIGLQHPNVASVLPPVLYSAPSRKSSPSPRSRGKYARNLLTTHDRVRRDQARRQTGSWPILSADWW